jgi:hypothetical protein
MEFFYEGIFVALVLVVRVHDPIVDEHLWKVTKFRYIKSFPQTTYSLAIDV